MPNLTRIGETLTVTGVSFPGFTIITQALLDPVTTIDVESVSTTTGTSVLPTAKQVGADSGFTFTFVVPAATKVGAHSLQLAAGGVTATAAFVVITETDLPTPTPAPTSTPVPTPTPGPTLSTTPAAGIEPLGDALVRL